MVVFVLASHLCFRSGSSDDSGHVRYISDGEELSACWDLALRALLSAGQTSRLLACGATGTFTTLGALCQRHQLLCAPLKDQYMS